MRRALFALLCVLATVIGLPHAALADAPRVISRASSSRVEVGEPFQIELKASTDQGDQTPTQPELKAPAVFEVQGPSIGTSTQMVIRPGVRRVEIGLSATWVLTATAPGRYTVPAPTVRWQGKKLAGEPLQIDVVPSTGRRPKAPPTSPFLLPGMPPGWPFGGDPLADPDDEPTPEAGDLSLPTAPDPHYFLRAKIDKTNAVVGEQLTLSFYLYTSVTISGEQERHEASLADFRRVALLKETNDRPVATVRAGGKKFLVFLLDRVAIFPLRAGDLRTGQMSFRVFKSAVVGSRARLSDDLVVHVTEPPKQDRPPAYDLGSVGRFELSASVAPRKITQGGALSVQVTVTGTGNLPSSLHVPASNSAQWLDPEVKEQLDTSANVVGGHRSFGYVVMVQSSGQVDLGTIELPYWDASAKRYGIASAKLGAVEVTPAALPLPSPSSSASTPSAGLDGFATLPGARTSLSPYAAPTRSSLLDGSRFWGALALPPLLVGLVFISGRSASRFKELRAARATSTTALAQGALGDAKEAEKKGDAKAAVGALERALRSAIDGAAKIKSRGLTTDALPAELAKAGLEKSLIDEICAVLGECDAARFAPLSSSGAEDLSRRARDLVARLSKLA
jgi:hypothetical protein